MAARPEPRSRPAAQAARHGEQPRDDGHDEPLRLGAGAGVLWAAAAPRHLSADALARSAAELRPHLVEGAPRSRVVALECDRGLPSVLALVAVLRAGRIPLLGSADDPPERRRRLRALAGAEALLAHASDGGWRIERRPPHDAGDRPPAAYLTATSGTTGHPRISAVHPRVLAAYVEDVVGAYGLRQGDRVLQFAPPAFDVFIEEVLPTLAAGGQVVVPPWRRAPAAAELLAFLDDHAITVVNLPSSYWMAVAEHLRATGRPAPAALRLVVIGSEPVARRTVEWWRDAVPHVQLLNAYGVAELAPTSYVFDCADLAASGAAPDVVPIGRPLPHAAASSVMDGTLRLAVHDDLRDTGVAPVDTGDLAAAGDDGVVVLHGRRDLMRLKRAGVTVNGEAVARAAAEHPAVLSAVPRLDPDSGELVLAVRGAHGHGLTPEALERDLATVLPALWLPDRVELVEEAAAAGAKLSATAAAAQVLPAAGEPLETLLRDVWRAELGGDPVVEDTTDFFDAGGDSVAAVRVCAAASQALGRKVPVQLLFAHPRLDAFAAAVARAAAA